MIYKPTHFINQSSPCINSVFSSNNCFVKSCGYKLSIYEKCHHNIIYETFSFDIPLPSSYYGHVWGYKHANTESVQKSVSVLDKAIKRYWSIIN